MPSAASMSSTRVETTIGRLIFNQILPPRLRYSEKTNRPMARTALREVVSDCYQILGRNETAHLVDGIKTIGFRYATQGGMTIAVDDIKIPETKGELLEDRRWPRRRHRRAVPARSHHRRRALRARGRCLEVHHREGQRGHDEWPGPRGLGDHDDLLRRPRQQGQHRPAGRHARPHGRPVRPHHRRAGALQLPRGHDRPGVLHLHARCPQGPGRHGPAHG